MAVKEKIGIVVSNKMQNTCIVAVNDRIIHKRYKKVITRTKRYVVHDSEFNTKTGDKVKIQQTRPISKNKRWRIVKIIKN